MRIASRVVLLHDKVPMKVMSSTVQYPKSKYGEEECGGSNEQGPAYPKEKTHHQSKAVCTYTMRKNSPARSMSSPAWGKMS